MRRLVATAIVLAALLPATAAAQGGPAAASVKPLFDQVARWTIQAAEQVPEDMYSFKPTPDVRSFGQLFGHVANAHYSFCSTAMGEASPNKQDAEKMASKAEIVAALKASVEYCGKAYEMSDAKAMEPASLFGMKGTRLWVLAFNATHDNEHYGNLVTYLRIKGMVPPSSQRM